MNGLTIDNFSWRSKAAISLLICIIILPVILALLNGGEPTTFDRLVRFIFIPAIAVYFVTTISIRSLDKSSSRSLYFNPKFRLFLAAFTYLIVIFSLKYLKLEESNYDYFDLGLYMSKLARIGDTSADTSWQIAFVETHFQPVLLAYSLIKKWFGSSASVLFIQSLTLSSSVVPIFLICKRAGLNNRNSVAVATIFLLQPTLHFSDMLGFHPDHLFLIILLWAFYFSYCDKPYIAAMVAMMMLLGGEMAAPTGAAFGLYLAIHHKHWALGLVVAITLLVFFFTYLPFLLPFLTDGQQQPISSLSSLSSTYSWLYKQDPITILHEIITGKRYVFVLFLFLPFFAIFSTRKSLTILLVASPDLMKTLFSDDPLHHSIEGHYTYSILPVILICWINYLKAKSSEKKRLNLIFQAGTLTMVIGIVHSPMPYSYNFFTNFSDGAFNYTQYIDNGKSKQFEKINVQIDLANTQSIVISNDAYSKVLPEARIKGVFSTPGWQNADYLILNKNFKVEPKLGKTLTLEDIHIYQKQAFDIPICFRAITQTKSFILWKQRKNKCAILQSE